MLSQFLVVIFIAAVLAFGWRRMLSYLRYFQQEEYNEKRFNVWLVEKRAYDTRGVSIAVSAALLSVCFSSRWWTFVVAVVASAALLAVVFWFEEDPRTSGKLKLNMTQRASKIFSTAFALYAAVALAIMVLSCVISPCSFFVCQLSSLPWQSFCVAALASALLVRLPPRFIVIANRILWPAEDRTQKHYVAEAKKTLREINPFVIGITGSYGKTGIKAAIGEILPQCLGPTFWPKKSINTVMGITRDIRENMRHLHKYAVIEMGAYGIGSIKRLCELTPPNAAIVTAVGIMHLERFGSRENVFIAKSELAQAVPEDGILVCNGDDTGARRMAAENPKKVTLLYGTDLQFGELDCLATGLAFDERGTTFTINWKGKSYPGRTAVLGRPALSNALGAFTMACALGAEPAFAVACLANIEPVDNRLVLDRNDGVSFLRDAYNSNPIGFAAALEVLRTLDAKRRILVTPGIVELGDLQFDENRRLAKLASESADFVIVVSPVNRSALMTGLADGGLASDKIFVADTREEAFARLAEIQQPGDLVLLENDLGDLLEGSVQF